MTRTLLAVTAILVTGCASQSGVVPIGTDTFMVSRQGMVAIQSVGTIKVDAIREGSAYCASIGKNFQIVKTLERQGVPGQQLPQAEVQFMCLNEGDRERVRPKMESRPDVVIQNK